MEINTAKEKRVYMTEEQFLDIQSQLRPRVNSLYDMQKQRIAAGGRIVSEFYAKMGIKPGKKISDVLESDEPEDSETQEEQKKAMKVLDVLKLEHKRITDVIAKDVKKAEAEKLVKTVFTTGQLITNKSELIQANYYFDLCKFEKELEKEEKEEAYETAVTDENSRSYINDTETDSGDLILEFDPESFEKEEVMFETDDGFISSVLI